MGRGFIGCKNAVTSTVAYRTRKATVHKNIKQRIASVLDLPPLEGVSEKIAADFLLLSKVSSAQYNQACQELQEQLLTNKNFELVAYGTTRTVFTWPGSNSIIKIPLNYQAAKYNQLEVAYFEQDTFYGHPVVPCKILWTEEGIPCVIMEKIDENEWIEQPGVESDWGINVDDGQISTSALLGGQWAAFDATYPPIKGLTNLKEAANADYDRLVNPLMPPLRMPPLRKTVQ